MAEITCYFVPRQVVQKPFLMFKYVSMKDGTKTVALVIWVTVRLTPPLVCVGDGGSLKQDILNATEERIYVQGLVRKIVYYGMPLFVAQVLMNFLLAIMETQLKKAKSRYGRDPSALFVLYRILKWSLRTSRNAVLSEQRYVNIFILPKNCTTSQGILGYKFK